MRRETNYELDKQEQIALMETISEVPLNTVLSDSVRVRSWGASTVIVTWEGGFVIPLVQLEAVIAATEAERAAPNHTEGSTT